MPQSVRQVRRNAKRLFRWCCVKEGLDERRARRAIRLVLARRRRGYIRLLSQFARLIRLERSRHVAHIQTAKTLSTGLRARIHSQLQSVYGEHLGAEFEPKAELIGGVRIQIGSDVYDNSVQGKLAALERTFGIPPQQKMI